MACLVTEKFPIFKGHTNFLTYTSIQIAFYLEKLKLAHQENQNVYFEFGFFFKKKNACEIISGLVIILYPFVQMNVGRKEWTEEKIDPSCKFDIKYTEF